MGSSGLVVSLLSSGIDRRWRRGSSRRGAVCIGVHFSGRPQTSDASSTRGRHRAGAERTAASLACTRCRSATTSARSR
ncbi:MAG: hypothetical protein ACLT98_15140 [Eggerthellaceae bacterium]